MADTRVQFYHNAEQPLALACELIGKAYRGGRKVVVRTLDAAAAQRLDHMLWTADPQSFIPHVACTAALAAQTPVTIATAQHGGDWPSCDLLFNLAADVPPAFEQFRVLVEIIGQHEHEKLPARQRWTHYKAAGLRLQAFDAMSREAL